MAKINKLVMTKTVRITIHIDSQHSLTIDLGGGGASSCPIKNSRGQPSGDSMIFVYFYLFSHKNNNNHPTRNEKYPI